MTYDHSIIAHKRDITIMIQRFQYTISLFTCPYKCDTVALCCVYFENHTIHHASLVELDTKDQHDLAADFPTLLTPACL